MITTLLLGSALAASQPPALPMAMPAPSALPTIPVAPAPAPHMAAPVNSPSPAYPSGPVYNPAPAAPCAECAAEEEATKYFAQKLLDQTRFGKALSDRGIEIYGWTELSYTGATTSRSNLPVTFNDQANSFQQIQTWLEVAKNIDTSKKEVQLGFKGSIFYGSDYRFTLARGLANEQIEDRRNYGYDPIYLYAEIFLPNLGGNGTTVRAGRWGTLIGYEVIDAVNTPFLTKSYNFQYNPFTHTGVMATTQINDNVTMYHGVVTGSDVFIDPAGRATYVGGVKYAPSEGKSSIAFNTVIGNAQFHVPENFPHFNSYNIVYTNNLTDNLTYVLDATASHMNGIPNIGSASWYGFANYFLYKVNDKLAINTRLELFDDVKGARTGTEGLYYEGTLGATWTPKDWLLVRPFMRYDYNSQGRPFEGDHHLYSGGIDLILRW